MYHLFNLYIYYIRIFSLFQIILVIGGGGGVRTHAAVARPNALAERPLQPNLSTPPKIKLINNKHIIYQLNSSLYFPWTIVFYY